MLSGTEYYPFGMPLRGGGDYRYGFNGKENDNEVKGGGLQLDYGFRIYDPRIAKFLSVDPLSDNFPWNSPYSYAEGDPINYIDLDGLERPEEKEQAKGPTPHPLLNPTNLERLRKPVQLNRLPNGPSSSPIRVPVGGAIIAAIQLVSEHQIHPKTLQRIREAQQLKEKKEMAALQSEAQILANLMKHTTDPSTLSDQDLKDSEDRISKGVGTAQDWLYLGEIFNRKGNVVGFNKPKQPRYEGPKPIYHVNEKHVKLRKGQDATALPTDAEDVFKSAIPDDPNKPKHWYGMNKDGAIYRFSSSNDGKAHFSGRSDEGEGIKSISGYAKERLKELGNK